MFAATQQGAAAMAAAFQVPYLGRIPLDPSLGRAAELGRSIFDAPKVHSTPEFGAQGSFERFNDLVLLLGLFIHLAYILQALRS